MPDRITTSNFDFTELNRRQALLGLTGASALLLSNPEPMLAQTPRTSPACFPLS